MTNKKSELEKFIDELKSISSVDKVKNVKNSREVWSSIGSQNWLEAGFNSESEAVAWMEQNSYNNLS